MNWSRERYMFIIDTLKIFLTDLGFAVNTQVSWCPISGLKGDNMSKTTSDKNAEWYRGDCLFDLLDDISIVHRDSNGPLRIPVVDKIRE